MTRPHPSLSIVRPLLAAVLIAHLGGCLLLARSRRASEHRDEQAREAEEATARRGRKIGESIDQLEKRFRDEGLGSHEIFNTGELWLALYRPTEPIGGLDALKKRLHTFEAKVAAAAGATAAYGDGTRSMTELRPEAREMLNQAFASCDDGKLALIRDRDPAAAAHIEDNFDVKMSIVRCAASKRQARVAADDQRLDQADAFPEIKRIPQRYKKGCGVHEVFFAGIHLGSGNFGPYSFITTQHSDKYFTWDAAKPIACGKFPRRGTIPREYKVATEEYKEKANLRDAIFVISRPTTERRYRFVRVSAYSNDMDLPDSKNPCGAPGLVCSAAGSPAVIAFEKVAHFMARAALHRDAGRAPRCTTNLKAAQAAYAEYVAYRRQQEANKTWVAGQRYKTALAPRPMSDKELTAELAARGRTIDEHLLAGDCAKRRPGRR